MESLATTNPEVNLSSCASKSVVFLIAAVGWLPATGQDKLRGMVFENDRYDRLPLALNYGKDTKLPWKASLKQYSPRVVNQSTANTGVAWAAAWYGFTIARAQRAKLSQTELGFIPLAPAFAYRKSQAASGCNDPVSVIDLLSGLSTFGAPRFSDFREFCVDSAALRSVDIKLNDKLGGYVRLFNTYDPAHLKTASIKQSIVVGNPVLVGMICPPSFSLAKEFWQPREPAPLEEHGGHAVTVVGFDDTMYGGAFEVVNSWGKTWGNGGFTWIRYEDFAKHVKYGFRLVSGGPGLKGGVDFFSDNGTFMAVTGDGKGTYRFDRDYKTGEQFQIRLESESPAYLHVVAIDPAGQKLTLFPTQTGIVSLFDNQLQLPGNDYYPLTEPGGKNSIVIIMSSSELALQQAVAKLSADPNAVLTSDTNWQSGRIKFNSKSETVVIKVLLIQR